MSGSDQKFSRHLFFAGHPTDWYRELLARNGPVRAKGETGEYFWLASRRSDVEEILKNSDIFRSSPVGFNHQFGSGRTIFESNMQRSDSPQHELYRQTLDSNTVLNAFQIHEDWFRQNLRRLWAEQGVDVGFDSCSQLVQPSAATLFIQAAGLDHSDVERVIRWSLALAAHDAPAYQLSAADKFKMLLEMRRVCRDSLVTAPVGSLLGAIRRGCDLRRLTIAEADSFFGLLVTAGVQTIASAMSAWIAERASKPRLPVKKISAAIEETLRQSTPAAQFVRYASRNATLGDAAISQGDQLIVLLNAANIDPGFYACPMRFDSDRRNVRAHLAFGSGGHFCVGAKAARLALSWFAEESAPWLERAVMVREDQQFHGSAHLPGYSKLPIRLVY